MSIPMTQWGVGYTVAPVQPFADDYNDSYAGYLAIALACCAFAVFVYRASVFLFRWVRNLLHLSDNGQASFKSPNARFAFVKRHIIYAPLFRTRHKNPMYLVRAVKMGILPTRLQTLFLTGVIAMNVVLCVYNMELSLVGTGRSDILLNHLRNRTGTLAMMNMIPLALMAGRNNPLIELLDISFDTFNLIHRWLGRIVVAEAVTHSIIQVIKSVQYDGNGWKSLAEQFQTQWLFITGLIAVLAFMIMIPLASTAFRNAFYETFLHLHIFLVITIVCALWYHLYGLHARVYLKVMIALWALERFARVVRLLYRNFGKGGTKAMIEALPGDAVRLTINMARPWTFRPGQHMYVTVPSIGFWTSHPFSLAWSEEQNTLDFEKRLVVHNQDISSTKSSSMSAVVRRRDGFTHCLFKKVKASADGRLILNAFVEGPYGGRSLDSYGTVMLFAGGVGITHQFPYVRHLITGLASGAVVTRRVVLIWIIQSVEHFEWVRPWMKTILELESRSEILDIQLFITGPSSIKEIQSLSSSVRIFTGRPNLNSMIGMECQKKIGAMAVSVCGPGALSDDVRAAVRKKQDVSSIDLVDESFSW